MTGVVQEVVGKMRYLVRFQDGLDKDMLSNQLTIVVIRCEVEEDIEVREVDMIPEVYEDVGYYHWVYIFPHFIKKDGVDKREDKLGVNPDTNEEDIKDMVLDDDREHHWHMVFEDNNGEVDGTKALIHAKKWYV